MIKCREKAKILKKPELKDLRAGLKRIYETVLLHDFRTNLHSKLLTEYKIELDTFPTKSEYF